MLGHLYWDRKREFPFYWIAISLCVCGVPRKVSFSCTKVFLDIRCIRSGRSLFGFNGDGCAMHVFITLFILKELAVFS